MRLKLWRRAASRKATPSDEPISKRASGDWSPGCMAGFFSVFLLAGLGFGMIFFIPAYKLVQSQGWTPVECEILSSDVGSHSGDSTTYSIDVSYRYVFDGVEYTSDRYEFIGGSSSGYDSKKKKVDALPVGSTTTCYVDPDEPAEAVLYRGLSWPYLFVILPLVFIAIGGGGVLFSLVGARSAKSRRGDSLSSSAAQLGEREQALYRELDPSEEMVDRGPIELEETMSPWGKLGCLILIALFWNGIVGIFVWQLWKQWSAKGSIDGCMTVFLVPFVLVGLALLVGVPYQFLALANPRPKLTLSRSVIPLGETAQLTWSFTGSVSRLQDLRIWVEGAESATYRRGTTSSTSTEVFATLEVVERRDGMPVGNGSATVRIPAGTMHSLDAGRNKILWKLKLHASIARWPDVMSEFPLVVAPAEEGVR